MKGKTQGLPVAGPDTARHSSCPREGVGEVGGECVVEGVEGLVTGVVDVVEGVVAGFTDC